MNKIVKFFHELRNPHCPHCLAEAEAERELKREAIVCQSCENLKLELAKAHDLNRELISTITHPRQAEEKIPDIKEFKPITPQRHLTFAMRKQMLEAEDRRKAQILREQAAESKVEVKNDREITSPTTEASTEVDSDLTNQLELELDVVSNERNAQSGVRQAVNEG